MKLPNFEEIKSIFSKAKLYNLSKHPELPQEEVVVVGCSNEKYGFHTLRNLDYSKHKPEQNSYGGYFGSLNHWWTMNSGYSRNLNYKYLITLDKGLEEEGGKLAQYMNFVEDDWTNLDTAIKKREEKIFELQKEIELLNNMHPVYAKLFESDNNQKE